jgi:NADH-quinone oxidoreductase subunit G
MEIRIDGRTIEAREGETLLQAALRHGIDIPYFCYHPALSTGGNCRMCLVKVAGVAKLMPACNLAVAAKMEVETASAEVQRARRDVMQFTMLNHPVDCAICDKAGECTLQDHQDAHGTPRSRSREPKHHKRKLHDLTPRIQLDNERCILCSRCVRFTKEISRSNLLGIVERGGHAYVERNPDADCADAYSDNVVGLCPTGALLSRDFLYKSRVWYLEPVRSVCNGCARGCGVNLWRRKKQWRLSSVGEAANRAIYRVTAADDSDTSGPWLCNKGFDLHKTAARERATTPMIGGAAATIDQALAAARALLAQARRPAALVSSQASSEELDAFQAALGWLEVYTRADCAPAPGEVVEDAFLIMADKNPNGHDVHARFGTVPLTAADARAHDLFMVWGEWTDYASLGDAKLIHLTAYPPPREPHPQVHIPLSTWMERDGTFVNFEGKRNRFRKVLDRAPLVAHAVDVFARLAP